MMHAPLDDQLVEAAKRHGCLAPRFTRDHAPTAWRAWERRAVDVIMGAANQEDMTPLCREADKFSGHDVPMRNP